MCLKMMNDYLKIQHKIYVSNGLRIFSSKQFECIKVNNNMIDYENCVTIT